MKKQTNEIPVTTTETEYKAPVSITLCYLCGIIGLFAGVIMIIRGINLHNADGYIGGGFIGGSIMLFVLYYIANDIHYMSWQAEKKAKEDKDYQAFVLRHLQCIEEKLAPDNKPSTEKKSEPAKYMDI